MRTAYVVAVLAGAAYAARAARWPFVDGDLFWQKHLGEYVLAHGRLPRALGSETFTAAGAPWIPHEWLLGIAAAIATQHGALWILGIAAGAAVASSLLLCARRAVDAGASGAATAICLVLLSIDVEGSFGIRAQVFAWPLFCALLLVLDRRGRTIFWSLPIVAAWANVHASAMLAIPIVWIDALAAWLLRGARDGETKRRALLALATPFATLATPLGIALPRYALALLGSSVRRSINEWQPIGLHHDFFWYGGAPLLLLILLCARSLARERPRDLAWTALLAAMAASAVRNVALLGFVSVPPAARAVDGLLSRWDWWPPQLLGSVGLRRLAAGATAVVTAAIVVATWRVLPARSSFTPPVATFGRIAALRGVHRVFCYDFTICSIALDYPSLRVFMDGRADPYPPAVWDDFNLIRYARPRWQSRLRAYGVDVTIARRGDALDRGLRELRGWTALPVVDSCCRAFVRTKGG